MVLARVTKEQFDALPEILQAEYAEADGKYTLKVDSVDGLQLADVNGIQQSLSAAREDAKQERSKAGRLKAALGDQDTDELLAKLEQLESLGDPTKLSNDEQVTARIKSIEAQFGQKLTAAEEKATTNQKALEGEIERLLIDAELGRILGQPEYAGSSARLLRGPVKETTRVAKGEDGKFRVEVLDPNGNPQYGDGTNLMGLEQHIKAMKSDPDFSGAFGGAQHSGAGSAPDSGTGRTGSNPSFSSEGKDVVLTHEQALDHGIYMKAKEAAEKAGGQLVVNSPWADAGPPQAE